MDITIRTARPEEFDAIGELTAAAYLDDGLLTLGAADPYLERLRDAADRARNAQLLVAADTADDAVLGAVAFTPPGSSWAELAGPDEGEFRMLAVAPAARRRGVAEALVRACLERSRALGLRRVVISSDGAMHSAHRLYGRLGFVRIPERDWEPRPGKGLLTFSVEL